MVAAAEPLPTCCAADPAPAVGLLAVRAPAAAAGSAAAAATTSTLALIAVSRLAIRCADTVYLRCRPLSGSPLTPGRQRGRQEWTAHHPETAIG